MARQRTKSLEDIYNQARRLQAQAQQNGDMRRAQRISVIRDNYVANIRSTKSAKNLRQKAVAKYDAVDMDGYSKALREHQTKQYARSTYMGIGNSNG